MLIASSTNKFFKVYDIDHQHILICSHNCKQYEIWYWYISVFGPKSILSVEVIKTHSKSQYIMNGAFVSLLKYWKITYSFSSGSKPDFVWLIAR